MLLFKGEVECLKRASTPSLCQSEGVALVVTVWQAVWTVPHQGRDPPIASAETNTSPQLFNLEPLPSPSPTPAIITSTFTAIHDAREIDKKSHSQAFAGRSLAWAWAWVSVFMQQKQYWPLSINADARSSITHLISANQSAVMTEKYQGWSLPTLRSDGPEDNSSR